MFALFLLAILVAGSACGGGSTGATSFTKISAPARNLAIEDFEKHGLKKAKTYDVSELPGATAAHMGYFTPSGSDPIQYEFRMYPDHAAALASGVEYAVEVTGEDALLRSVDVRWDEGTKDRRGGGAFRDGLTPLYGDYAVVGNVILLCGGRDSAQALERCAALLNAVGIGVEG